MAVYFNWKIAFNKRFPSGKVSQTWEIRIFCRAHVSLVWLIKTQFIVTFAYSADIIILFLDTLRLKTWWFARLDKYLQGEWEIYKQK